MGSATFALPVVPCHWGLLHDVLYPTQTRAIASNIHPSPPSQHIIISRHILGTAEENFENITFNSFHSCATAVYGLPWVAAGCKGMARGKLAGADDLYIARANQRKRDWGLMNLAG